MPIKIVKGDMFQSEAEAFCNPVNCVGVMGKGLALEFSKRFPQRCKSYFDACEHRVLLPGRVLVNTDRRRHPNTIFHVATKDHWRKPSEIAWIKQAVRRLAELTVQLKLYSIAIPALGCGNGGLSWGKVKRIVTETFDDIAPNVLVELYPPTDDKPLPKSTTRTSPGSSRAKVV